MCFCLHCTPDTIISFENYNPGITESGGPWRCAELLPQLHLSLNQANRFDFHLFKDVGAFSTFSFRLVRYRDYCYVHVHIFSDTRTLIIVKQLCEYVKRYIFVAAECQRNFHHWFTMYSFMFTDQFCYTLTSNNLFLTASDISYTTS